MNKGIECNPHKRKGKGIICECNLCHMIDYCLDYSEKFEKESPFYVCKFCYKSLFYDVTGSLHNLYKLPIKR